MSNPPMLTTVNAMTESAFSRLIKAVGRDKGLRIGGEALSGIGLKELQTPNDLLRFANYLINQGGATAFVGSALKVSALLRGAVESKTHAA